MNFNPDKIAELKVTIMGLGLHGGGLASTIFFARYGARVTVTDLRTKDILAPTIARLKKYSISYTLGEHRIEDFKKADIVIKNPAVPLDSPFLKAAKRVETDISIFLSLNKRPVIAVTGSKGKSTTVSAVYHVLKKHFPGTKLGGNITVSPLTFVDECMENSTTPVILELSSWQLADLKDKDILKPKTAVITNIMPDHQNRYSCMDEYVADKKLIYRNMGTDDHLICNFDDEYGKVFVLESKADPFFISRTPLPVEVNGAYLENGAGYLQIAGETEKILPAETTLPGEHNKLNLLCAAAVLHLEGLKNNCIADELADFNGIPHRMEQVAVINGVYWYNDSAATIPQATAAAVRSFRCPVRLILGGTDKELRFDGFAETVRIPVMVYLIEGSATDRMIPILKKHDISFKGPFKDLKCAVQSVYKESNPGESILFSPGATSFGMFLNEFDRGDRFREMVKELRDKE